MVGFKAENDTPTKSEAALLAFLGNHSLVSQTCVFDTHLHSDIGVKSRMRVITGEVATVGLPWTRNQRQIETR